MTAVPLNTQCIPKYFRQSRSHLRFRMGWPGETRTHISAINFSSFQAFDRIQSYIDKAKTDPNLSVVAGGTCDKSKGYFVEPTILETKDPHNALMKEEIFGPVVTAYVYPDGKEHEMLDTVRSTSPYALTGETQSRFEA